MNTIGEYLEDNKMDRDVEEYASVKTKLDSIVDYGEPLSKNLKVEETCDANTSYDRHDYNKKDKASFLKHITVRDQSDYTTKQKVNVKGHVDVRYTCNQCDYKAKWKRNLKQHTDSVHGDVRFICEQCDYKATQKGNLKRHIRRLCSWTSALSL